MAVWIPQWDLRCEKCSDGLKRINGCDEDCETERWRIREWTWNRCPIKLITPETHEILWAYRLFQLGKTPIGLGWKRESNKYLEAMKVIDSEIKGLEAESIRKTKNG